MATEDCNIKHSMSDTSSNKELKKLVTIKDDGETNNYAEFESKSKYRLDYMGSWK